MSSVRAKGRGFAVTENLTVKTANAGDVFFSKNNTAIHKRQVKAPRTHYLYIPLVTIKLHYWKSLTF